MTDEPKYTRYKIIVSSFTLLEAQLVVNYLRAFDGNRTVELEGIES